MSPRRRLSESISEGDGISLLVRVASAADVAAAEAADARALVVSGAEPGLVAESALPVLATGDSPDAVAGSDAWCLVAEHHAGRFEERYEAAQALGLECVVDIHDDEELERVLELITPEIVLLSPRSAEPDDDPVDRLLELLPDVPAGMLVIAELGSPASGDVHALERAGVDAVLVDASGLAAAHAPA